MKHLLTFLTISLFIPWPSSAQEIPAEATITPTWETQTAARRFNVGIPAPRGQITDRAGRPLAQTRIGYDLCLTFPTPLNLSDTEVVSFARERLAAVTSRIRRPLTINQDQLIKHYRDRGLLPLEISLDLQPAEVAELKENPPAGILLRPVYYRFYPNGSMAGHILGYVGRRGRTPSGPIRDNELLWADFEGREGIEKEFNQQLAGSPGQMSFTFDEAGNQSSERLTIPPQPGNNVIMTLDEELQRSAEAILQKSSQRGAIVVIDPRTGDILAMASWPSYNPNDFVPSIPVSTFKALQDDPNVPLLPRAYRSAYPPGSIYKMITAIAAVESGIVRIDTQLECPPSWSVGNLVFRNWKKTHAGSLNAAQALTQSCNTWFYQVGIKTRAAPIVEWSHRFGLGERSGIPLSAEALGRIPDDDYMRKVHNRPIMDGDLANMSIGQGDILVSPLQMAQAMGVLANDGIFYQTRLVSQVQSMTDEIVTAYNVRAKDSLPIGESTATAIETGMVDVVTGSLGTAARARVPNIKVAGKTGTAQWGPKSRERRAAWFVGYAPADAPRYAFAALYEGGATESGIGGGSHAAPMIGTLLREIFIREEDARAAAEKAAAEAVPEAVAPGEEFGD